MFSDALRGVFADKFEELGIGAGIVFVLTTILTVLAWPAIWELLISILIWMGIAPEPEWAKLDPDDFALMNKAFENRHVRVCLARKLNEFPRIYPLDVRTLASYI